MNGKLACFTLSLFNALLGIRTERAYAIELVVDAVWRVYWLWSSIALGLARVPPGKTTSLAFGSCPEAWCSSKAGHGDFRQEPDRSDDHGGQSDDRIIAQGGHGFQGHVAGALNGPFVVLFQ